MLRAELQFGHPLASRQRDTRDWQITRRFPPHTSTQNSQGTSRRSSLCATDSGRTSDAPEVLFCSGPECFPWLFVGPRCSLLTSRELLFFLLRRFVDSSAAFFFIFPVFYSDSLDSFLQEEPTWRYTCMHCFCSVLSVVLSPPRSLFRRSPADRTGSAVVSSGRRHRGLGGTGTTSLDFGLRGTRRTTSRGALTEVWGLFWWSFTAPTSDMRSISALTLV